MSNNNLETAISVLQYSPDPKGVLKALISIRNEVDWPKNKHNIAILRERGCLKQITGVLSTANHKNFVDLALSILGNCLMDRTCTSEVVAQHNIMSVLNQVLKKYPKEDSISGRTFRIVGNMCQHRDQWATIIIDKKPLIISHIVDVVKKSSADSLDEGEKISEATIFTALRALRELLNCHTVMALVKQFGALKAIGALFIKYSTQWQENKQNEKMLLDVVRVIQEYSRFKYYHSILEMRNTDRGDSLVHLSSVLILAPRRIVKIVMNFIRSCQLQSELPIPEICSKFVEVLEKHSVIKEFEGHCTELLQCLCYLLYHPANRNRKRCGGAIPLLIKILREFEEMSNNVIECCILLIHTLNKFKYDDRLMLEQLQCGIISVLITKLSWIVGPPDVMNWKHNIERKRKYTFGTSSPVLRKRKYLQDDTLKEYCQSPNSSSSDDEFDVFRCRANIRSPSPCSSSDNESVNALSWSEPSSSPSQSFVNSDSDSDNYSPVCSEVDETEFPLPHDCGDDHEIPDPFPPVSDLGDSVDTDNGPTSDGAKANILNSLKTGLCQEIVKLIKSYTELQPPHLHLANVDLLMQLTKCAISQQFDTRELICDIIKPHEYLIPLLQTDYIQTIYDIRTIPPNHDSCSRCFMYKHIIDTVLARFTEMAESGAGKGDIAHKLLRGDLKTKQKLVMVIPYIIGNRLILGKLMLNCGGLDILMKLLQDINEQDNRRSLKVLCQMATCCLRIINPSNSEKNSATDLSRPKLSADKYRPPENCGNVVAFEFDDGSIIKADRDFLIAKSEYFNGLLNGHFKESEQSQITLSNVEARSFRCMLHLLANVDRNQTIEIDLDLETLLDVILLCDRYLLVDLCVSLTDSVEQFRITPSTVPVIYNWSVESGTNLLRVESVVYSLVAHVDERERFKMFQNLFNLGYKDQLVDDIEQLLKRYLSLSNRVRDFHGKKKHVKEKMRDTLLKNNI